VLTPLAPLREDTNYEVWGCDGEECRHRVLRFTTGSGLTNGVPAVPELVDQDHDRSGGGGICPREKTIELRTTHEGLLVLQHESRADLGLTDVDGLTSAIVITVDEVLELDQGGCDGSWPGGRRAEVRLGALDLAGNFSGFSDPHVLDIGCGCRSDRPASPGLVALGLTLGGLLIRRRR
jgi:MYXO-CTERM domain-containing protein